MSKNRNLSQGNKALINKDFNQALNCYELALTEMPELKNVIKFNIQLTQNRKYQSTLELVKKNNGSYEGAFKSTEKKLPITVLIVTWDIGHNPLGRSYMLAEVVQRVVRHSLLVGFQFPRYGNATWEPVRGGDIPVVTLPGANLPEFFESLQRIALRINPDVVIACKSRLPSVALGMMIKKKWGCPLIVDIDDHELTFFKDQSNLTLDQLDYLPKGGASNELEPYGELWTRLTQTLSQSANEIIVSNVSLQKEFGGTIVPHVRNENTFDPDKYDKFEIRKRFGLPMDAKLILFFGTLRAHKGIETLASAVRQINNRNFQLLVVGSIPDRNLLSKIDEIVSGRVIYLPNQPFNSIPEILAMVDVVCLPQDEGHPISRFQLPAKAIDAVAMGIPLLVSDTPPLKQLVQDQVAELVRKEEISEAIVRLVSDEQKIKLWRDKVRPKFLAKYSYNSAAAQLRELITKSLQSKSNGDELNIDRLLQVSHKVLGQSLETTTKQRQPGTDIILFWKQNDTGLYGRRHDMVIKYLASRADVRKVIVFDAPISEFDLINYQKNSLESNQNRSIYQITYQKKLGILDTDKVSYNVFILPPGKYRKQENEKNKPHMHEDYFKFIEDVLKREVVESKKSIFWIYPKNYAAPEIIEKFDPLKVIVDVVDDHRVWPGTSINEKLKLTENYKNILKLADMAFANCDSVKKSMEKYFPNILKIENGCDASEINQVTEHLNVYNEIKNWPGKKIGYVGNLESKINVKLLEKIADTFKECMIILVGSTHTNPEILKLKRFANIRFPGVVPYKEIAAWVSEFDVGLVPHFDNELTKRMNPLKVFVYLSNGVPVVTTNVLNIDSKAYGVYFSKSDEDFIKNLNKCLYSIKFDLKLMSEYVLGNSWEKRLKYSVDEMLKN